jgi:hypothetical protein
MVFRLISSVETFFLMGEETLHFNSNGAKIVGVVEGNDVIWRINNKKVGLI